jgi:hypothetical protein
MPAGCVCVSSVSVAPWDSDDESLQAYELDVSSRTKGGDTETETEMPDLNSTRAVDAFGFPIHVTPESARARARCDDSAARRAPRWQVYRDDPADTAARDFLSRRLASKKNVDAKLGALIRKGVPRDLRERVWMRSSGAWAAREKAGQGHYLNVVRDAEKGLKAFTEDTERSKEKRSSKDGKKKKDKGGTNKKEAPEPEPENETSSSAPSPGSVLKPFVDQIDLDIARTFPENPTYHGDGSFPGQGQLAVRRVLLAYAATHPEVGYCQGMNYVCAFLWLAVGCGGDGGDAFTGDTTITTEETTRHTAAAEAGTGNKATAEAGTGNTATAEAATGKTAATEETTYWLFTALLDDVLPSEIYARDVFGTLREFRVLKYLLKKHCVTLHKHFEHHGIDLVMLQSKWLLCVLTDSLPGETCARVLDVLFSEGSKAWFRVVTATLATNATYLKKQKGLPEGTYCISQIQRLFDHNILTLFFKTRSHVRLEKRVQAAARQRFVFAERVSRNQVLHDTRDD